MTTPRTYRIEERLTAAGPDTPINTIPGLAKDVAEQLAAALRTGTAYTSGERELTIVQEQTAAEKLAAKVEAWRTTGASLDSSTELIAALQSVIAELSVLPADEPMPSTYLSVLMRVDAPAVGADEQADTVVVLAEVLHLVADRSAGGHLSTPAHLPVRVMTTANPAKQPTAPRLAGPVPPRKPAPRNRPVSGAPAGGGR